MFHQLTCVKSIFIKLLHENWPIVLNNGPSGLDYTLHSFPKFLDILSAVLILSTLEFRTPIFTTLEIGNTN